MLRNVCGYIGSDKVREGVLHSFNVESVHCVTSVQIGHRRRESFPEKGTSRMKRESMVKLKR